MGAGGGAATPGSSLRARASTPLLPMTGGCAAGCAVLAGSTLTSVARSGDAAVGSGCGRVFFAKALTVDWVAALPVVDAFPGAAFEDVGGVASDGCAPSWLAGGPGFCSAAAPTSAGAGSALVPSGVIGRNPESFAGGGDSFDGGGRASDLATLLSLSVRGLVPAANGLGFSAVLLPAVSVSGPGGGPVESHSTTMPSNNTSTAPIIKTRFMACLADPRSPVPSSYSIRCGFAR
jgi:hypothetical protein